MRAQSRENEQIWPGGIECRFRRGHLGSTRRVGEASGILVDGVVRLALFNHHRVLENGRSNDVLSRNFTRNWSSSSHHFSLLLRERSSDIIVNS